MSFQTLFYLLHLSLTLQFSSEHIKPSFISRRTKSTEHCRQSKVDGACSVDDDNEKASIVEGTIYDISIVYCFKNSSDTNNAMYFSRNLSQIHKVNVLSLFRLRGVISGERMVI